MTLSRKEKLEWLTKASVNIEFLNSNSTTYDHIFGALAEIVDNARDADAKTMHIFTEPNKELRGEFMINFLDDGIGMSRWEMSNIIKFGMSAKKFIPNKIGLHGNGLKSSSMRIGNDLLVFTKNNSVYSILFLSKSFLKGENLQEVYVPIISYSYDKAAETWRQLMQSELDSNKAICKHVFEVSLITKYSPFKTEEEILEQFDKIKSESGTLVIIYNLKLSDCGKAELDIDTDPEDILVRNLTVDLASFTSKCQLEHKSLRQYLSILYLYPNMKIYVQHKKVHLKILERSLFMPRQLDIRTQLYGTESQKAIANADKEVKEAKENLNREKAKLKALKSQKEIDKQLDIILVAENALKKSQKIRNNEKNTWNEKRMLKVTYGVNLHNKLACGIFVYSNHRLIFMFQPMYKQIKKTINYEGIIAVVNVPYYIIKPTLNKQNLLDKKAENSLLSTIRNRVDDYLKFTSLELDASFWKLFGYANLNVTLPSDELCYVKKRWEFLRCVYLQCDKCLKWRAYYNVKMIYNDVSFPPDDWCCQDNNQNKLSKYNLDNCHIKEQLDPLEKLVIVEDADTEPSQETEDEEESIDQRSNEETVTESSETSETSETSDHESHETKRIPAKRNTTKRAKNNYLKPKKRIVKKRKTKPNFARRPNIPNIVESSVSRRSGASSISISRISRAQDNSSSSSVISNETRREYNSRSLLNGANKSTASIPQNNSSTLLVKNGPSTSKTNQTHINASRSSSSSLSSQIDSLRRESSSSERSQSSQSSSSSKSILALSEFSEYEEVSERAQSSSNNENSLSSSEEIVEASTSSKQSTTSFTSTAISSRSLSINSTSSSLNSMSKRAKLSANENDKSYVMIIEKIDGKDVETIVIDSDIDDQVDTDGNDNDDIMETSSDDDNSSEILKQSNLSFPMKANQLDAEGKKMLIDTYKSFMISLSSMLNPSNTQLNEELEGLKSLQQLANFSFPQNSLNGLSDEIERLANLRFDEAARIEKERIINFINDNVTHEENSNVNLIDKIFSN